MKIVTVISKEQLQTPTVKERDNEYLNYESKVLQRIKYPIIIQTLLGINRLYVIPCPRFIKTLSYVYTFSIICVTIGYVIANASKVSSVVLFLFENGPFLQYIFLVFLALINGRKSLKKVSKMTCIFDVNLNIHKSTVIMAAMQRMSFWVLLCIACGVFEQYLLRLLFSEYSAKYFLLLFFANFAQDCEIIFIFSYIRIIYLRVLVIKAHVEKMFNENKRDAMDLTEIELLSLKAELDISTLHKSYEVLEKLSRYYISSMSFPVLMMVFVSGVKTISLLKWLVSTIKLITMGHIVDVKCFVYILIRCLKNITLTIIPCYYASITSTQASCIHNILNNALVSVPFETAERRKVKALLYLSRECNFSYVLFGVIKLNMSLPLSYISICVTYLIIVIQFAKFID